MDEEERAYAEQPYESRPIPWTAPEQLSLLSQLYGGPAPPVNGARYLEIGCGDAANVLALAHYRRDGRFVGIDISAAAVERGRAVAEEVGADNLELHAADLASASDLCPSADYVVAHGLLSWIGADKREVLLEQIASALAPEGVGFVSYNTLPGWGPRGLVRDVLLRAATADTVVERLAQARAHADFLLAQLQGHDHPYARLMCHELARVGQFADGHLAHDLLARHNTPFWLRDFVAAAERRGLVYVGDVWLYQAGLAPPQELLEVVQARGLDPLAQEELVDVLRYRQLRCSLVRRRGEAPGRSAEQVLGACSVAAALRREGGTGEAGEAHFVAPGGYRFSTRDAELEAALVAIAARYPAGIPWSEIDGSEKLGSTVLQLFVDGQVSLRLREPTLGPAAPPERPVANALVRHQAATHGFPTTPTHESLTLSAFERSLLTTSLDGRPLTAVAASMEEPESSTLLDLVARLSAWGLLEAAPSPSSDA
jgi:SAM-dependent methyltransferase